MAVIATMLAEIMDSPDFAEIMFLVAFILFLIEFIRIFALARNDRRGATTGFSSSLAWLASPSASWPYPQTQPHSDVSSTHHLRRRTGNGRQGQGHP